ncbi:hypothetical protein HK104_008154 [Borealophlyctis nickersoniae]|nr:hypothetical protein HK104_008154 [Borealophlyctis nickersoniae]
MADTDDVFSGQNKLLINMGFTDPSQNRRALAQAHGKLYAAIDLIVSGKVKDTDDDDIPLAASSSTSSLSPRFQRPKQEEQKIRYRFPPLSPEAQHKIFQLHSMGFRDEGKSRHALSKAKWDVEVAAVLLLEKAAELDSGFSAIEVIKPKTASEDLAAAFGGGQQQGFGGPVDTFSGFQTGGAGLGGVGLGATSGMGATSGFGASADPFGGFQAGGNGVGTGFGAPSGFVQPSGYGGGVDPFSEFHPTPQLPARPHVTFNPQPLQPLQPLQPPQPPQQAALDPFDPFGDEFSVDGAPLVPSASRDYPELTGFEILDSAFPSTSQPGLPLSNPAALRQQLRPTGFQYQ